MNNVIEIISQLIWDLFNWFPCLQGAKSGETTPPPPHPRSDICPGSWSARLDKTTALANHTMSPNCFESNLTSPLEKADLLATWRTSGYRGGPSPKIFSKLCSFQAILSKFWGQNSTGLPLTKTPYITPLPQFEQEVGGVGGWSSFGVSTCWYLHWCGLLESLGSVVDSPGKSDLLVTTLLYRG